MADLTKRNPAGRPKASRNKLGEAFREALFADWRKHGPEALRACREQNAAAHIKVIASLLPKQVDASGDGLAHLCDDTINDLIRAIADADDGDDAESLPH